MERELVYLLCDELVGDDDRDRAPFLKSHRYAQFQQNKIW